MALRKGSLLLLVARRLPCDDLELLRHFDVRGDACLLSFTDKKDWCSMVFLLFFGVFLNCVLAHLALVSFTLHQLEGQNKLLQRQADSDSIYTSFFFRL